MAGRRARAVASITIEPSLYKEVCMIITSSRCSSHGSARQCFAASMNACSALPSATICGHMC